MSISLKDVVKTTLADCTLPMPALEFLVGLHMPTTINLQLATIYPKKKHLTLAT